MHILRRWTLGSAALAALISASAYAEDVVVNAKVTQWDPMIVFVKPGDTVTFRGMAGHDTQAIESMIPEGAKGWHSTMGEDFTVTMEDKPGAYVYKCTPHVSEGMVGVIVVGDGKPSNLDALEKSPENKSTVARAVRKLKKELETKGML